MNTMDHAKWRDVKTTDAFGDLIGRCYCCDHVAALKLSKYNRGIHVLSETLQNNKQNVPLC